MFATTYIYDDFYDNSGNKPICHLIKVTNPKGAATVNTYDNLGRLIRTDYPQDGVNPMMAETFTYDNVGNLKTKTNGKGIKTLDYEFYAGYRLKKITEPNGKVVNYTYDANDNPLTQSTSEVTYTYTYDVRNRVTNLKAQLDGYTFNIGYDYDTFGRVTGISYPGRTSPMSYSHDELDLLQTIPGFVTSCSYDADNKLTAMALANGITNTYSYDVNDRPTNISVGSLMSLNYSYDPVGNVTQINNDYYDYDGMNRLTWYGNQAKTTGTALSYDDAGNMSEKRTMLNGTSQTATAFSYDQANRLWSMGSTTYTNDNAGERTGKVKSGESWSYLYDGESRLFQANKNGSTQVQCAYDGSGMRYKKVEKGKTTYYIYNGSNPLVEYTPSDGKYTYRIYAGKRAVAEEKDSVIKFFHKDHLGSTRIVTDANGNKVAEYKYAPYGEKEISTGTGTDYQFTDKATDESTGLSYFGARFYDPEVGRFITQDPAKDGANWFVYCKDNPLTYIDNNGKWSCRPGKEHDMLTWYAIANSSIFSEQQKQDVMAANRATDTNKDKFNLNEHYDFNHQLSDKYMDEAVAAWNKGEYKQATEALGRGLHCIQDTYAHKDLGPGIVGSAMHSLWDILTNKGVPGAHHPDDRKNNPTRIDDAQKASDKYNEEFESRIKESSETSSDSEDDRD